MHIFTRRGDKFERIKLITEVSRYRILPIFSHIEKKGYFVFEKKKYFFVEI